MSRRTQDTPDGFNFVGYRAFTFFGAPSQELHLKSNAHHMGVLQPQRASSLVWALPLSLAATQGIEISFSSCG